MGGTRLYCMIALILAGAAFLTLSMGYIGLPRHLAEWIGGLGLSQFQLILALTAFYVLLGCFLDGISMVVLTMGVILPTIQKAGIDPLWFGIFIVIVVEMAQVTPPVGFNLFVLQGMTKGDIGRIARAAFPFFLLMVGMVILLYVFPQIVTFLPEQMRRLSAPCSPARAAPPPPENLAAVCRRCTSIRPSPARTHATHRADEDDHGRNADPPGMGRA